VKGKKCLLGKEEKDQNDGLRVAGRVKKAERLQSSKPEKPQFKHCAPYTPTSENEPLQIVVVTWVDSATKSGWQPTFECAPWLLCCQTVGFLVEENDQGISVALNRALDPLAMPYGDIVTIPTCAIKHKQVIKVELQGKWKF
jgi:hypothetical protein